MNQYEQLDRLTWLYDIESAMKETFMQPAETVLCFGGGKEQVAHIRMARTAQL